MGAIILIVIVFLIGSTCTKKDTTKPGILSQIGSLIVWIIVIIAVGIGLLMGDWGN